MGDDKPDKQGFYDSYSTPMHW